MKPGSRSTCRTCHRPIVYHTGQGLPWWEHHNGNVFCGEPYGTLAAAEPVEEQNGAPTRGGGDDQARP